MIKTPGEAISEINMKSICLEYDGTLEDADRVLERFYLENPGFLGNVIVLTEEMLKKLND